MSGNLEVTTGEPTCSGLAGPTLSLRGPWPPVSPRVQTSSPSKRRAASSENVWKPPMCNETLPAFQIHQKHNAQEKTNKVAAICAQVARQGSVSLRVYFIQNVPGTPLGVETKGNRPMTFRWPREYILTGKTGCR